MTEYKDKGCIDIVSAVFKKCLNKTRSKDEIKSRMKYVSESEIFRLWCIVSEHDHGRLRNLAIVRNHKFIKEL